MKAADSPSWSTRRWVYTVAAVFLTQLLLLWWLGERPRAAVPRPGLRLAIQLATDPAFAARLAQWPELTDPALFALPHRRGFSGPAWLTVSAPHHELAEWSEPPRWLAPDPDRLGDAFARFLGSNTTAPLLIADKPLPRLTGEDFKIRPLVPAARSTVRRDDGTPAPAGLDRAELPSWPNSELLTNSLVQALVDEEGRALSVILLQSSGLKEADQYALQFVGNWRFNPPPDGPSGAFDAAQPPPRLLRQERLFFAWHTLPPAPATNVTAALP
jgi:TonB family protein